MIVVLNLNVTLTLQDKNDKHQVLRAIQFAYETGNAEVTKDVAMALFGENKFAICDMQLTAVDLLAIIAMIESHGEITDIRYFLYINQAI